jgi:REP element-mobilizing transposase RayT
MIGVMGRKIRDLSTSEWQHVINRGSDRQDLFSIDGDRLLWEHLVGESFAHFDVELHAFVWMTNHVHMLTHCDDGDLSAAMQRLCFRYASAYNERTGRDGPLFTGRFRNEPILSDAQLHQTARYIHRNPLAMVPAAALDTYRWSSLGPLVGARAVPDWLSTGVVGGPDYLRYVLDPQPGDRVASGSFSPGLSCDDVDVVVSAVTGVEIVRLRDGSDRRCAEVRALAVMLAVELRVATADELAVHYGLSDSRSIRRLARRGRVRVADSRTFARLRERTLSELDRAA